MKVWREVLTKNFILMIIGMIVSGAAQMMMNTNLASYAINVVGIEQAQLGTAIAIGGIVAVVLYPIWGILCDKMRYGVCAAIGAAITISAFVACINADGLWGLALGKSLQLAGFGLTINAGLSIAATSVKAELRPMAMTLYGLGPALTYFIGPQMGTNISIKYGFNQMFSVCIILAIVGAVLFLINTSKPEKTLHTKKNAFGFEKTAIPGFILSFLILQIVFIAQTYSTVSLLERGIQQAALFWTVGAIVNIIARFVLSGIIAKVGINITFYGCVTLLIIAVVCIVVANNLVIVLLAAVCWGIGYNGTQASIMSVSVLRAPADRVGQANSTHQIGHNLAQVVWAQIAGILAGILGYQGMFLVMLIPIAAGIIFFITYVHRMVNRVEAQKAAAKAESEA